MSDATNTGEEAGYSTGLTSGESASEYNATGTATHDNGMSSSDALEGLTSPTNGSIATLGPDLATTALNETDGGAAITEPMKTETGQTTTDGQSMILTTGLAVISSDGQLMTVTTKYTTNAPTTTTGFQAPVSPLCLLMRA